MTGAIEFAEQKELKTMPQHAASAWSVMGALVGASYKPIAYVGQQIVKGVNHVFIAEQTLLSTAGAKHMVLVTINEFDGEFGIVNIDRII